MYFLRSANILAFLACMLCLMSQVSMAMPQLMRPKLHVLGVVSGDSTDSEAPAVPTPEVVESPAVTVAVGTPLVAAASSVPETSEKQTNGAISTTSGISAMLIVGTLSAAIQLL